MKVTSFIGGSYQSQSPLADCERTINWYPENLESKGGTTQSALYPTPGVQVVGSASPGGGGRAHFAQDGREFVVIGPTFTEIGSNGNPVGTAGAVAVNSSPATISSNGKAGGQLFVTAGGHAYIFTLATNAFAEVATLSGKATMGDQIDGYFLALDSSTGTFYWSDLNDGLTWQTGVNFANRSSASDSWIAMKVVNSFIMLMGSATSEPWYDAGTFPMPFAKYPSPTIPFGCAAAFSPAITNGLLLWLGTGADGGLAVLQSTGFTPTVVSTFAISTQLDDLTSVSDAIGDTDTNRGHSFYRLNLSNITLCYDLNTKLWHERATWISENSAYVPWRPRFHVFAFGQHRWLDSETGAIYWASETFTTDVDSRPIRRLRRAPLPYSENQRIFLDAFELEMEIGLGNTNDPGSNPQVMLRMSSDGGKTWGIERWRSAGAIGEYKKRVRWNRLGAGRRPVVEVSVSDGIQWRLLGATVEPRQAPAGVQKFGQAQAG